MNRLFVEALRSIGVVKAGDNPDAEVVIWKSKPDWLNSFDKRTFSPEQREQMAMRGTALPDGSFPIANLADLKNAIQSFGRAADPDAARRHIIKRARALGAVEILPASWNVSKVTDSAESASVQGEPMDLSAIEDQDLRKSIEDTLEAQAMQISDLEAKVEALTPAPTPEEVAKTASDEVQAIIKAQGDELAEVRKQLAAERSTRLASEFVAKAEPFKELLGKPEEVGPVLADLAADSPEAYAKLEGMLTAAGQRVDLAKMFKEAGASAVHDGEASPEGQRDRFVKDYIEKNPGTSVAEARGEFWKQHPEQVEESRSS